MTNRLIVGALSPRTRWLVLVLACTFGREGYSVLQALDQERATPGISAQRALTATSPWIAGAKDTRSSAGSTLLGLASCTPTGSTPTVFNVKDYASPRGLMGGRASA
jgi:hypothetical protein